jgi:hypothetical protein
MINSTASTPITNATTTTTTPSRSSALRLLNEEYLPCVQLSARFRMEVQHDRINLFLSAFPSGC